MLKKLISPSFVILTINLIIMIIIAAVPMFYAFCISEHFDFPGYMYKIMPILSEASEARSISMLVLFPLYIINSLIFWGIEVSKVQYMFKYPYDKNYLKQKNDNVLRNFKYATINLVVMIIVTGIFLLCMMMEPTSGLLILYPGVFAMWYIIESVVIWIYFGSKVLCKKLRQV